MDLTIEQANEVLNQIANQEQFDSLSMHIEDSLEEEKEIYSIDVLADEVEPLYIALAGARGLTAQVAHLRALL